MKWFDFLKWVLCDMCYMKKNIYKKFVEVKIIGNC